MATVILPNVPSVVRFAVQGANQGQKWVNVFHAQYSGTAPDAAGLLAVAQQMQAAWHNTFGAITASVSIVSSTVAQDLTSRTAPVAVYSSSQAGGDSTSGVEPLQAAICCSWIISDRYRGGHPRTYIAGLVTNDVTGGRLLNATGLAKWQNAAAGFLTDVNAMTGPSAPWRLVCVRYFSQHQLLPNPFVRLISSSAVHQRIDTQRRRLGKEVP